MEFIEGTSEQVRIPSREEYILLAKVAEEAERYEGAVDLFIFIRWTIVGRSYCWSSDLVSQMKGLIQTYGALTIEERNLLSVAYKNITNALRSSWRIIDSLEKLESSRIAGRHSKHQVQLISQQRSRVEHELAEVCKDIVKLLDDHLLSTAEPGEETVFYYKM